MRSWPSLWGHPVTSQGSAGPSAAGDPDGAEQVRKGVRTSLPGLWKGLEFVCPTLCEEEQLVLAGFRTVLAQNEGRFLQVKG